MEKKRKEIIDAAKGEEYLPGTVDVKFLDNITMLLNKPYSMTGLLLMLTLNRL